MVVRFKKKPDGTASMTCIRSDGTSTGQRSDPFFVWHDLEHYAIETTLGLKSASYGLLDRGWDIGDFGAPWPRGRIPPDAAQDAAVAEFCAGMLDLELAGQPAWSLDESNTNLQSMFERAGVTLASRLTENELDRIRATYQDLEARYAKLPPGNTLELPFPKPE